MKIGVKTLTATAAGVAASVFALTSHSAASADSLAPVAARGVGTITSAGQLDPESAINISQENISHPKAGLYCFSDLPFLVSVVQATADSNNASLVAHGHSGHVASCPPNSTAAVRMTESSSGGYSDGQFSVVIFQKNAISVPRS